VPGLQGWAEKRKTDREGRRPLIREGHIEFRQAIERTSTGSLIDESRSRWTLAAPPPRARIAARGGLSRDSAEGVLCACQAAVGGACERPWAELVRDGASMAGGDGSGRRATVV
jgi:hypothetical protein